MLNNFTTNWDEKLIGMCSKWQLPFARFSLFLIYGWFGALKIPNLSPANPLVGQLLEKTLPFITFDQFIVFFGIFEVLIGILFLFPRVTRIALILLVLHMGMTVMPMVLLPSVAWQGLFVPTLEGQYMIKNILIVALALTLVAHLDPLKKHTDKLIQ